MDNKFCFWEDEEVKTLFRFVEIKKSEGLPLIKIFSEYARHAQRQPNSVRNYYYKELANLINDNKRKNALGIDLSRHSAKKVVPFSKEQTQGLVKKINEMVKDGYSVRGACLKLACSDASLMVRLQNKYRLETKYKGEGKMGNIIKMPIKKDAISDEEINALFLGLIKLVKKQEGQKARQKYDDDINDKNQKLRKAIDEIVLKNKEIEQLQKQITILKEGAGAGVQKSKSAKNAISEFVKKKKEKIDGGQWVHKK